MRLLCIESSGGQFSVAGIENGRCLAEICRSSFKTSERGSGTSAGLILAIRAVLTQLDWRGSGLDAIAVSKGPGSFTGLRVGITAATTMAYSLDCPLVGIDTHAVLAFQARESLGAELPLEMAVGDDLDIRVVTNAQRQQLFFSRYRLSGADVPRSITDLEIVDREEWVRGIGKGIGKGEWATGSGLRAVLEQLEDGECERSVTSPDCWEPTAASMGGIAGSRVALGDFDDLWTLRPLYFRPSAAEEKAKENASEKAKEKAGEVVAQNQPDVAK